MKSMKWYPGSMDDWSGWLEKFVAPLLPYVEVVGLIITAIAVAIAAMKLWQGLKLHRENIAQDRAFQARSLVLDYASKICTDKEFVDTAHYLIYTYSPSRFKEVERKMEDLLERKMHYLKKVPALRKEENWKELSWVGIIFDELRDEMFRRLEEEDMLVDRKEGCRLYHPRLFQGSAEEKRLDNLLTYLSTAAYYFDYYSEDLPKKDVEGTVGHLFLLAAECLAVDDYFEFLGTLWEEFGYQEIYEEKPFSYLKKLIDKYWKKNKLES